MFMQVALVNGLVMGGGAAMVAPLKFAVVTEKTVCANNTPLRPILFTIYFTLTLLHELSSLHRS
jgi:hypothetical protein